MLKIKDNVDLKELEKFGFVYYTDKNSSYYGCCIYRSTEFIIFINNARRITLSPNTSKTILEIEILYDLIKADLVEKAEEN